MSQEPATPLPQDLVALLEAERQRPSPSDADRDLVRQRLEAIVAGGGGSGSSPGGSSTRPAKPSTVTSRGPATPTLSPPLRHGTTALALAFLVGGGAGALLHSQLAGRPQTPVETRSETGSMPMTAPGPSAPPPSAAAPATTVPLTASATPLRPTAPTSAAAPKSAAPTPSASAPLTKDEHLAAERALVDTARSALARGDASAGLAALSRHEAEFPHGQLTEEREALAVQALALAGRRSEAADRAGGFRLRFPHSVLLPVVNEAVGSSR